MGALLPEEFKNVLAVKHVEDTINQEAAGMVGHEGLLLVRAS